jgi:hypothetical protein
MFSKLRINPIRFFLRGGYGFVGRHAENFPVATTVKKKNSIRSILFTNCHTWDTAQFLAIHKQQSTPTVCC